VGATFDALVIRVIFDGSPIPSTPGRNSKRLHDGLTRESCAVPSRGLEVQGVPVRESARGAEWTLGRRLDGREKMKDCRWMVSQAWSAPLRICGVGRQTNHLRHVKFICMRDAEARDVRRIF